MKLKEMKQVVDMLYEEWDLGKTESGAKGKTCAWIYLFEILEESEKIILEKENNKLEKCLSKNKTAYDNIIEMKKEDIKEKAWQVNADSVLSCFLLPCTCFTVHGGF